jgi:hypothetical protein
MLNAAAPAASVPTIAVKDPEPARPGPAAAERPASKRIVLVALEGPDPGNWPPAKDAKHLGAPLRPGDEVHPIAVDHLVLHTVTYNRKGKPALRVSFEQIWEAAWQSGVRPGYGKDYVLAHVQKSIARLEAHGLIKLLDGGYVTGMRRIDVRCKCGYVYDHPMVECPYCGAEYKHCMQYQPVNPFQRKTDDYSRKNPFGIPSTVLGVIAMFGSLAGLIYHVICEFTHQQPFFRIGPFALSMVGLFVMLGIYLKLADCWEVRHARDEKMEKVNLAEHPLRDPDLDSVPA